MIEEGGHEKRMGPVIAVMQPYFVPYAGYFRLFQASDLFVIYDDVQFPKAGYVHRNRLPDALGAPGWLSLPLAKAPLATPINRMMFAANAPELLARSMRRFPSLVRRAGHPLREAVVASRPQGLLVDYLVELLAQSCALLGLPFRTVRASQLSVEPGLKGAERVIAMVKSLGAREYVNLSGGRHLYQPEHFRRHGIRLRVLDEYQGPSWSILERILTEPAETIRQEIVAQS